MLHNSGIYGLQKSQMNMESTRNVTPSSSVVNIAENFKNVNNLQQQTLDLSQTQTDLADFRKHDQSQIHNSSILDQYKNCNSVFNSDYSCNKGQNSTLTSWQNGVTAPNGVIQTSNVEVESENHDYVVDRSKSPQNDYVYPEATSNKPVTLNIPKYMVKSNRKTSETKMEVNDDINNKPERVFIDSIKRKSLENTVRLIENILMNTTRRNEILRDQQQTDDSVPNSIDTLPKYISESEDSDYNKNNNNSLREEKSNNFITIQSALLPNNETLRQSSATKTDKVADDGNPIDPILPEVVVKTEPLDEQDMETENCSKEINPDIVVKVEELTVWEDMVENPFLWDTNGVKEIDSKSVVIDRCNSVNKATENLAKGTQKSTYYECPYCALLIQHPKRFLIHTKWHNFGIVGIKREEIKKEKELIRQKRKEELVRLKEEEATDPVTGQRMHRCTSCDKKFPTKNSMKYHRKRFHPKLYEKLRECKICNKQFPDWKSMQAHKKTHMPESEYVCDECPKKFKYPHSLAKHKQTHWEKTHQCPDCPKAFGSAYLLKTHAKTHERIAQGQTHRCSYCGKGYYNAYTLQVHERTHRNEKPFVCNICNTSYGTNSSLTRHLKVSHGGAKPFECATCHRCFMSERIRERHAARAHGDPGLLSHACALCDCRYLSAKYLRKHMEKVHPKEREKMKRAKRGSFSE